MMRTLPLPSSARTGTRTRPDGTFASGRSVIVPSASTCAHVGVGPV